MDRVGMCSLRFSVSNNGFIMPLTAIEDFRAKGAQDPRFTALADIVDVHNGLWCPEAEEYLLAN